MTDRNEDAAETDERYYRMKRQGTQFADRESKFTLAWPIDSPPEFKKLPQNMSTALADRVAQGAIVPASANEIRNTTGEVIEERDTAYDRNARGPIVVAGGKISSSPDVRAEVIVDERKAERARARQQPPKPKKPESTETKPKKDEQQTTGAGASV